MELDWTSLVQLDDNKTKWNLLQLLQQLQHFRRIEPEILVRYIQKNSS